MSATVNFITIMSRMQHLCGANTWAEANVDTPQESCKF